MLYIQKSYLLDSIKDLKTHAVTVLYSNSYVIDHDE